MSHFVECFSPATPSDRFFLGPCHLYRRLYSSIDSSNTGGTCIPICTSQSLSSDSMRRSIQTIFSSTDQDSLIITCFFARKSVDECMLCMNTGQVRRFAELFQYFWNVGIATINPGLSHKIRNGSSPYK